MGFLFAPLFAGRVALNELFFWWLPPQADHKSDQSDKAKEVEDAYRR